MSMLNNDIISKPFLVCSQFHIISAIFMFFPNWKESCICDHSPRKNSIDDPFLHVSFPIKSTSFYVNYRLLHIRITFLFFLQVISHLLSHSFGGLLSFLHWIDHFFSFFFFINLFMWKPTKSIYLSNLQCWNLLRFETYFYLWIRFIYICLKRMDKKRYIFTL